MKDLTQNEKMVVEYLNSIETRKSSDVLGKYYHPDIEQIEFPNAVVNNTVSRRLKDLKDGSERGQKIMSKEEYEMKELCITADSHKYIDFKPIAMLTF